MLKNKKEEKINYKMLSKKYVTKSKKKKTVKTSSHQSSTIVVKIPKTERRKIGMILLL